MGKKLNERRQVNAEVELSCVHPGCVLNISVIFADSFAIVSPYTNTLQ